MQRKSFADFKTWSSSTVNSISEIGYVCICNFFVGDQILGLKKKKKSRPHVTKRIRIHFSLQLPRTPHEIICRACAHLFSHFTLQNLRKIYFFPCTALCWNLWLLLVFIRHNRQNRRKSKKSKLLPNFLHNRINNKYIAGNELPQVSQIFCEYKNFYFGERIQKFPDKLLEIVRYVWTEPYCLTLRLSTQF